MNSYVFLNHAQALESLRVYKRRFTEKAQNVADAVIENKEFQMWSGSLDDKHHCGEGGLLIHTAEVVHLSHILSKEFVTCRINPEELFLAALYHDIGKIKDYTYDSAKGKWVGTPHKRLIHHISESNAQWIKATHLYLDDKTIENVSHAILAHHCFRAYGSPVAPRTRIAWLVHLADQASARMNDIETFDIIDARKE